MPEGDTIHRTARTLERVLCGRVVRRVDVAPGVPGADRVGHRVERVEARGKNLLVHFDDEHVLYSHMRMSGSWHVYRVGERWRRPQRQLKIALTTDAMVAACFNAPVVELLSAFRLRQHRFLARLGPDLLATPPDLDEAVRRARSRSGATIGEVVMAQDVACGIGNVYKSETLFLQGIDPFEQIGHLTSDQLRATFERAHRLMRENLSGFPRTTRHAPGGGRYWVYGRGGEPCFVCGAPIAMRRQGDAGRSTYHCTNCQRPAGRPSSPRPRPRGGA